MSSEQKALEGFDEETESQEYWQSKKNLSEFLSLKNGKYIAKKNQSSDKKYPVYGSNGIIAENGSVNRTDEKNVDDSAITIGRVGSIGEIHRVEEEAWISDNCMIATPEEDVDYDYIYYLLKTLDLASLDQGTSHPMITQEAVKSREAYKPPLEVQKEIADKLRKLDDKIGTNSRINEILEEIAQALFQFQFVDFEPYDDLKKSEIGEVPEEFSVGNLSKLVSLKNGKYIKKEKQAEEGEYPIYGSNGKTERTEEKNIEERCITVGRVGSIGEIHRVEEEAWISDNCIIAKPDNQAQYYYLYLLLTQYNFERYNQGSSHPMITQEAVKSRDVAIPPDEEIEKFEKKVEPLFKEILRRKEENEKLEEMRDTLLPKLMSGELRVNVDGDE